MLDAREPPHGDFVAFVEQIEREQLARALQPHKLPQLVGGKVVAGGDRDRESRPLASSEAQRVLQSLQQTSSRAPTDRGPLFGAVIGAALIAFGLIAEGGIILVLVGAVLLWHNLRKLRRSAAVRAAAAAVQDINHLFGPSPPRGRSGISR